MITPEQMAKSGLESGEQKAVFVWAALNLSRYPQLKWLHAIPNANSHKQVAEGVRSGISDIMLPYPTTSHDDRMFAGLYIEMKTESRRNQKNGGLSDDQVDFINYAKSVGYRAEVCYGWQAAIAVIEDYLES